MRPVRAQSGTEDFCGPTGHLVGNSAVLLAETPMLACGQSGPVASSKTTEKKNNLLLTIDLPSIEQAPRIP
jgi:hypothetical protein